MNNTGFDKNTIITVVLLALIFIGWTVFFPAAKPQPKKPITESALETAQVIPITNNETPFSEEQIQQPLIAPREIVIKTAQYQATFDERGGRLKDFKLLNYYKRASEANGSTNTPVELTNNTDKVNWSFGLNLSDETAPKLALAPFIADVTETEITLNGTEEKTITFTSQNFNGLTIKKQYVFSNQTYKIKQAVIIDNKTVNSYDGYIGMDIISGSFSKAKSRYAGLATYINGSLKTKNASKAKKEILSYNNNINSLDWLAYMDQYFLTGFLLNGSDTNPMVLDAEYLGNNNLKISAAYPLDLMPNKTKTFNFDFYYGPKNKDDLKAAGHNLEKSVDLGWFHFISKPLAVLLHYIYKLIGNYGVAIIIVTLLIKIVLWPLTSKSYKSMREMQKLQPAIAKLREKYAGDKQEMNKEVMILYKKNKINPLGGCLPMLLQVPFFIAFYRVLDYTLELRGAPFMLWITDLSAPDRLFNFNVSSVPLMEAPYGIPVLTLLMGGSMLLQQKMMPNTMGDPMQAKMMMMMPIVFTFILLNMPAGLVLYWLTNNILSIFQQKLINKQPKEKKAKA